MPSQSIAHLTTTITPAMEFFNQRRVFWLVFRTIALLLTVALLPISVLRELGDHKNIIAFVGVSFPRSLFHSLPAS